MVALAFIGAFFASVVTVIYTGLNVEGSRAEFDAGFRPVTLRVGEMRAVDLVFQSESRHPDALLEITLPDAVQLHDGVDYGPAGIPISMVTGENRIPIEIEATAPGSGYLVARVTAGEPVGIYRLFVTVTTD
ncbi:MAG: hypothetical protein PVH89_01975 [Gammaproteobacteria bacterium]